MTDYKYYSNFEYPQFGIYLKVKSNKLDINNMSRENIKKLGVSLRKPIKFIVHYFCIPLSYDVDAKMFEIKGFLLLYNNTYKYYSELPHKGTITYLTLETINRAMEGKFPEDTDIKTNIFKRITKNGKKT